MKIAFIYSSYFPLNGGVANATKNIAEAMKEYGDDVTIYTIISGNSTLKEKELINGVQVRRIRIYSKLLKLLSFKNKRLELIFTAYYIGLIILFERTKYDVFYGHNIYWGGTIAHILSKINGGKSAAMAHGEDVNQLVGDKYKEKITKKVLSKINYIISTNTDFNKILTKYTEREIHLIPNVFNTESFNHELLIEKRFNGGSLNLLCIGRLDVHGKDKFEIKGFSNVLKAMNELPNQITLEIIGEGELKETYNQYILENNLSSRVKLLGAIDFNSTQNKLNNCSVVLLPSNIEGLSMVMLETMSKGLPLLATKVGGAQDFITNKQNGLLINIGDYKSIISQINEISQNFELYKSISINSKKTYLDNFTGIAVSKKIHELFKI